MGWTSTYKEKGLSMDTFFKEHGVLRWSDETNVTHKILASAFIRFNTYYAAIERVTIATGLREVFAVVILIKMFKEDRWGHNITYKDMDESVGPCQVECPERILKLLTSTEYKYAKSWRERCWARIAAKKARPKIAIGTKLKYGGDTYKVTKCLGRRGYQVDGLFRLKLSQAARSEIL